MCTSYHQKAGENQITHVKKGLYITHVKKGLYIIENLTF